MKVFRRNAQPHIADMRKGGAWGYVPNKQICVWGPRRIACRIYLNSIQLIALRFYHADRSCLSADVFRIIVQDLFCSVQTAGGIFF